MWASAPTPWRVQHQNKTHPVLLSFTDKRDRGTSLKTFSKPSRILSCCFVSEIRTGAFHLKPSRTQTKSCPIVSFQKIGQGKVSRELCESTFSLVPNRGYHIKGQDGAPKNVSRGPPSPVLFPAERNIVQGFLRGQIQGNEKRAGMVPVRLVFLVLR